MITGIKLGLILSLGLVGAAAGVAVILATPWGMGLSPDSTVYIGGARSLLRGAGFSLPTDYGTLAPVVHFPPLYSVVLAMLAVTGAEPLDAARWLASGLFACNAVLAGALGFSVLHSVRLSVVVGLFALTAFPMVQVHTIAWSEPLFIALQLGGVLALLVFLRKQSRRDLILTAVVFGCSALVRYAGLATLVAGGLLSPLYIPLLVVGLSLGARLWHDSRLSGVSRAILALSLMTALAAQSAASIDWLKFSFREGVGYAGREWRNSETLAKLAALPPANRIYSNAPDVLYILHGTPAAMIPRKVDPQTSRPNRHYAEEMAQLRRALNEDKAILAYFNRITWRWYLPAAGEVEDAIAMRPWARTGDGLIFTRY